MTRLRLLRAALLPAALAPWLMLAPPARPANLDVSAQRIVRDAQGAATAIGDVDIRRGDESLHADQVHFDPEGHRMTAEGNVRIRSPQGEIRADKAELDTSTKQGVLHDARVTLNGGARLEAERIERTDAFIFRALHPAFTTCPADAPAWDVAAASAVLDQREGTFTARHARFRIGGVPVLYTPWWRQATRRKSGLLLPRVGAGKRRGTEVALPLYLAPSPGWDMTLTPHWMSARGLMGELEWRHADVPGREELRIEGLRDRVTASNRGRLRAKAGWRLPWDMNLSVDADHVTDHDYLADFSSDAGESATRFLQSRAALTGGGEYGWWQLWGMHQQDLTQPSNAATLQILPRLDGGLAIPLADGAAVLHFDQQTTRFARNTGLDGWRLNLHPWLELPWSLDGGGLSARLFGGVRHYRYWLNPLAADRKPRLTAGEFGAEVRAIFERFSDDGTLRHSIEPVLRYDVVNAPEQTAMPNFDSAFGRLTMGNLLSSNRFSGQDRVERVNRASLLLVNRLQSKDGPDAPARDVLVARIGASYNIRRRITDAAIQARPPRPFSNLVGDLTFAPWSSLRLVADGQYDPAGRFFDVANATLAWTPDGHSLSLGYHMTDARYADETQTVSAAASLRVSRRWRASASWNYDTLRKFTQRAEIGLSYHHPCWHVSVNAYRINRPSGTTGGGNFGANILLEIDGLGSVGQCAGGKG